ncbi:diguanylate cyclase [Colwellia sp. PAMC 21821]|uniref:GGDEF domain-containing protein n=1 Tax=Colwellia sp. PAMC 21821 TaxID=1816219 RepID=UPI0012DCD5BD|nr:diguanylate cyclase [Colwellia sp. PAMC 21821]
MLTEALFVGMVIVFLFGMRQKFGIALLYITLGTFQYLQTVLATFLYFEIFPGVFVSPGSAVLFNASLFAVLLIYIKEDAAEARKLIYGLVFANLTLTIFLLMVGLHLEGIPAEQLSFVPEQVLSFTPRVLIVGTLTLAIDVLLIIILYEFFAKYFNKVFLKIYSAMAVVLIIDTLVFTVGSGIISAQSDYIGLLLSSVVGKLLLAVVYSSILALYIKHHQDIESNNTNESTDIKDIFTFLTYRQKYEKLRKEIYRDSLTGLYNRGFLNENLPRELDRAVRNDDSIAFLMIDIDNFKHINDTFGHQEGDRILAFLAMVIHKSIRKMDLACRYGGEEFSLILPKTDKISAIQLAERLRDNLTILSASHKPAIAREITLTIGIAMAPKEAITPNELVSIADKRLYLGKASGRNCIVSNG